MVRHELSLPVVVMLLLAAGVLTLSTAAPEGGFVARQLGFAVLGMLAFASMLLVGRNRLLNIAYPAYWFSIALLVLTRLFGLEINGAQSWLKLGPLPAFQASEFANVPIMLALALSLHERPIRSVFSYLRPGFLAVLPFALVFMEPDLGGAMIIAAILVGMLLVRGIPWQHIVIVSVLVGVAAPTVIWPNLKPHQKTRVISFLNPEADPQGSGYQVIQSRIAIGSGGLLGKGYKQGTQSQFGFIPYQYADFIFPVLAEEGGFIASVSLMLLYVFLFWRLVSMAAECPYERDQFIIVGALCHVGFQVILNIGVSLGLAPVTGITLPLVSYGGTSVVATFLSLGLAYVVHRDRHKDW